MEKNPILYETCSLCTAGIKVIDLHQTGLHLTSIIFQSGHYKKGAYISPVNQQKVDLPIEILHQTPCCTHKKIK